MARRLTIKALARTSGVSVRTLRYYDEIGLLTPAARTTGGYRVYGEAEMLRLQQILIRRALGLPLAEIARVLDDPTFDYASALIAQREQLVAKIESAETMIAAVDAALAALEQPDFNEEGWTMGKIDFKAIFDGFDPADYEDEVKARWGDTEGYRISTERSSRYTEADWRAIKDENESIYADAAALLAAGESPESEAAMDVAERHRRSIDRWFYPVSYEMHRHLADMYEMDSRFAARIDKAGEGLTPFLAAAIRANAARGGADAARGA